jgi:IS5 family transposase
LELIELCYPKTSKKGGLPPYPLSTMLRIHLMPQWYSLSYPSMEEALIDVPTMRRFAGIDLMRDRIPDETTILTFRHLLEQNELAEKIFETVKGHLKERGTVTARKDDVAAADQAATAKVAFSVSAGCDGGLIQTTPG